eukprot:GHVT01063589.1.p1 GENE.GHVT01063589.1~~GHVT01063589.1.p1  ORF type:complete len:248 (-),score=23.18 GHVT01063589.1:409-1152(-)
MSDEWGGIHLQRAELPEEEFVLMEHTGRCYSLAIEFDSPDYRKWLFANDAAEMKNAYPFHKRFLQHLQWQRKATQWVLKMPFHLFALDALFKTYPDANIIFMHRDPTETISSWASLCRTIQGTLLKDSDPREIGQTESQAMSKMIESALEFRQAHPELENRFFDVQYESLVSDPLATIKSIYTRFNVSYSWTAWKNITTFVAENKKNRDKLLKHKYKLEDVGLDAEMIKQTFKSYYNSKYLEDTPSN